MRLPSLAWKNMLRYGKRTAITASAIAVGLAAYLALDSLLLGMEMESERNLIWYETGSAKVLDQQYWADHKNLPLDLSITIPAELVRQLNDAGVAAAPRIAFQAELIAQRGIYPEDGSMIVRGYGVDPLLDPDVFRIDEHLVDGRWLEPGENGVILGSTLAQQLEAEVGFPLIVVARTQQGYRQTIDVEIVGIVDTPNPIVNRSSAFVPIDTAAIYLQMENEATEVAIHLPETRSIDSALIPVREVLANYPQLEVLPWQTLAADYVALAEAKSSASGIILILVFVIAAVGISNTMIMAVFERTREIGTLRALGMTEGRIRLLFLYEAGAVGSIGSVAGLIVGSVATYALVRWGIDYTAVVQGGMDFGYRTAGIIRGAWHPEAFVIAAVVGVLLSILSAFLPTQHAVSRSVPECLRYQR